MKRRIRCAIYTRKSSEEGLQMEFNSLDAQREACAAYIESQKAEGWRALPKLYDDGGYSGGSMDRPALQSLLSDVASGLLDVIVVYKVDRLTRSLSDFAKIVDILDQYKVSFVSVTQHFNTTSSMGRLTLNVLLSFAQSFLSFRSDEAQPTSTHELPSNSGLTSVGLSHSNRPGCRGVSR